MLWWSNNQAVAKTILVVSNVEQCTGSCRAWGGSVFVAPVCLFSNDIVTLSVLYLT
uniref:Uncharacterized protein n=1 Tax=Yersinia ruckeri TaxID=29486 RepID=A0A0A8V980_YERRU|nr:hypothetical protein CSF007_1630 [Yersinia ruckeri]